jgi:hypothetical protein
MEDDLISSLTRQVKEEVVENYLTERRIVELQTEDVEDRAGKLREQATETARRLNRLSYLVVSPEMREKLVNLLKIPEPSFWHDSLRMKFSRKIRFIRVRSLTERGKFLKLLLESYRRLYAQMERYRLAYEDLRAETKAVNDNISKFHGNFDLLSIISFLKSLDTTMLERQRFLGENFTAEELASVDRKLYLPTIPFETLKVPEPLSLPKPETMEESIAGFASEIYRRHQIQVRGILQ